MYILHHLKVLDMQIVEFGDSAMFLELKTAMVMTNVPGKKGIWTPKSNLILKYYCNTL